MHFGKNRPKCIYYFILFLVYISGASAQVPIKQFEEQAFDSIQYLKFAINKKIPKNIKSQVLTALAFYPELKETRIVFRFRKRTTPLSSRPQVLSTFKKIKNRRYVITISTRLNIKTAPISFHNLPYNAQIGVLGHELAHITEYQRMNSGQLLGLIFKMLKSKYIDEFEYNTDLIAINHGLGYQLYDWSTYVRKALDIPEWRGASDSDFSDRKISQKQRYMNPQTIECYILSDFIYEKIKQ